MFPLSNVPHQGKPWPLMAVAQDAAHREDIGLRIPHEPQSPRVCCQFVAAPTPKLGTTLQKSSALKLWIFLELSRVHQSIRSMFQYVSDGSFLSHGATHF